MDPITQGLLGATAAQAGFGDTLKRRAWVIGMVSGMAADLDVLIHSATDPLLHIEFHRHFTHSLVFIPIGGLIAALPFLAFKSFRVQSLDVIGASVLAYATHGLLDACTSYGTQLLWPFTNVRVAWDCLPIVDPLFTGILILSLIIAVWQRRRLPSRIGLTCAIVYALVGMTQNWRAMDAQAKLAEHRGHQIEHGRAAATLLNFRLWRSVYRHDGKLYADAIHVMPFGGITVRQGESISQLDIEGIAKRLSPDNALRRDLVRFNWFCDGFIARDPNDDRRIIDCRYSMSPHAFVPLWCLYIDLAHPDRHAAFQRLASVESRRERMGTFKNEVLFGLESRLEDIIGPSLPDPKH